MSLPPTFSGMPNEEQRRYYRNICIELKKAIHSTQDPAILQEKIDRFLSASREVTWPHPKSEIYHKDKAEQAVQKVANEFRRYLNDLENNDSNANPEDLLSALAIVESML